MINWGDIPVGKVIPFPFAAFGSAGESLTISGLAVTDIEVYKGDSMTQRSSDSGYALMDTDGIDIDSRTGIHGFSIDTSDNSDSGFYSVGALFWVVVDAITVNGQTVRFVAGTFRLMAAESVAGVPEVDVTHVNGFEQLLGFNDLYSDTTNIIDKVTTVDTVVDAIKVTTDKLDDTLEDQGEGTYGFTEEALQEAPSGGGSGASAEEVWAYETRALTDKAGFGLADDAITAAKFDESTAFPLKSADSGSTEVARTGADGDTLETLSDEIAGVGSAISGLNDLSASEVNAEVDAALADIHLDHLLAATYDPASKPGAADALLNELVENDGGVSRFTANALEEAPAGGGGGGDATEAKQDAIIALIGTPADTDLATDIANVKAETAAIVNDTDVIDDATSGLVKIAQDVAAILVDTGTTLQGELDGIQADTEDIQSRLPAALTAGGNIKADVLAIEGSDPTDTINAQVDAALADYDGPTKAELDSGLAGLNDLSASEVRSAVGLASANLDTQLGDLPTNSELATAQAAIIDGVLDGIRLSKNTALNNFEFFMRDSTDHVSGKTGLTVTAQRSIDGASFGNCANSASEVGSGVYKISLDATDLNGDVVTLKFTATGADPTVITLVLQPKD